MSQFELYDTPRKINVELFYEIMKTADLQLLKVNQDDVIEIEQLENVWLDLQEYFYTKVSGKSYELFKRNFKTVVSAQAEIVACCAALELVKLFDERGIELLKKFKIKAEKVPEIESAIRRKITNLELSKDKINRGNKKESEVSFYKLLAAVERRLQRTISIQDYSLERWCELLEDLREKEDSERKYYNEQKSKRYGR